ncbi:hypothetical protein M407DRAFT_31177 [Tulasnella calospora MUT 4182]|uniref:PNK FHA domain-containing protein n=1 Tax=Tulasnella calospora MUT 4182 TaxID=1051891 RepID=A0A0C3LCH9_9AGAM|nr:hypothetical protein M407DRAFT_31177 [Tulasnella calospora MUT 4182]
MARQQVGRGSIARNAPVSFTTGLVTAAASTSTSRRVPKRGRVEDNEAAGPSKGSKVARSEPASDVHPFFLPKKEGEPGPIQWFGWLGGTCRHGVHLQPKSSTKVAAFDLDGTLIKPKSGAKFAKDHEDWKWWADGTTIPKKLKELDEEGYSIVIVTNQALGEPPKGKSKDLDARAKLPRFKKFFDKLTLIASALPAVPFRVFVATSKDQYRKPIPGTWFELEKLFRNEGIEIGNKSYYIGDAAGRDGDHNITDRLYAQNIGIPFHTPEPEIVLFVGYPAAGKTTFYKRHFAPAGYVHVNQDTLKTKPKCVAAVREAITNGQSCTVDNTNRDLATRADYHRLAKELNVSIRALVWNITLDLAWHINLYRAHFLSDAVQANEIAREMLGYGVFTQYQNAFQPPTVEEGFSEVKTINWIFEGSEEDRRRFNMYLDVS